MDFGGEDDCRPFFKNGTLACGTRYNDLAADLFWGENRETYLCRTSRIKASPNPLLFVTPQGQMRLCEEIDKEEEFEHGVRRERVTCHSIVPVVNPCTYSSYVCG